MVGFDDDAVVVIYDMESTDRIVEAIVEHVAVFGIFLRHEEDEILVLIPEVSWIACFCSCRQFAAPGDRLRVRVLGKNPQKDQFWGSIKQLSPDPWTSSRLKIGTTHRVRVFRHVENADRCDGRPGFLVEFEPGVYAMLCAGERSPVVNEFCDVRIVASSNDGRGIRIELVD